MNAYGWQHFALATSAKVASTSIAHAMAARGVAMMPGDRLRKSGLPVVGIIREPVDRFLSCYAFFSGRNKGFPAPFNRGPSVPDFLAGLEALAPDRFGNVHWTPQTAQMRGVRHWIPFERLSEFWSEFLGEPGLPHENAAASERPSLDRSILQRIQCLYAADAAQHAAAVATYDDTVRTLRWEALPPESRTPDPKPAAR